MSQMTEWVLLPQWDDYDRIMSQMTEWVLLPQWDDYDRIMSQMTEWVLLPRCFHTPEPAQTWSSHLSQNAGQPEGNEIPQQHD